MKEIELKLRYDAAEREKVVAWCERSGFLGGKSAEQDDYYLTPCHKNLFLGDEAFRVRRDRAGGKEEWRVTFKGTNTGSEFHLRRELETRVEDGREMLAILERMDFKPLLTVKKTRQSYCRGSVTICLDSVEGLGDFLEIEILDPAAGEEEAMERIGEIVAQIGLESARVEPKNYLQLLIGQG